MRFSQQEILQAIEEGSSCGLNEWAPAKFSKAIAMMMYNDRYKK